jgi:hypothetical protein
VKKPPFNGVAFFLVDSLKQPLLAFLKNGLGYLKNHPCPCSASPIFLRTDFFFL